MSTPRFARGSKSRLFLYIGAITVAGVVIYFFHHAQVELYDYQKKAEKCLQQQESLSAQFQVIIEYKVRLEKSLQQEKAEHRRVREELQGKVDEEKQLREKENLENINKFTSLQQQYKLLQSRHEDLSEECGRLRVTQLQGLDARSKLESALEAAKQETQNIQRTKDKEMENLKTQYLRLEVENEKLQKQNKELSEHGKEHNSNMNHLEKEVIQLNNALLALQGELSRCQAHSSSPVQMVGPADAVGAGAGSAPKASSVPRPSSSPVAVAPDLRAHVLPEPLHDHILIDKVSHTSQKSTTPQINPDAVLSREKAANVVPIAVAAIDTFPKITPDGVAGSSRKEMAAAAAVESAGQADVGGEDGAGALGGAAGGDGDGNDAGEAAADGEGALQAPNWEPNEIPNQAAFHAAGGGGGFVHGAAGGGAAAVEGPAPAGMGVGPAPPAHVAPRLALHAPRLPHVPAGVVPAPHGYGLDREPRDEVVAAHGLNQDGAIAQDPWHWRRSKGWVAPAMGAVGEAPRRRQLAEPRHIVVPGMAGNMLGAEGGDEAEEREKEIPRQLHNPYGEYNGDNGEYDKERHGDLQLEEGEEEEDDDVDQIDYANDNANGAEARQKRINLKDSIPNVNKHDSVMVNPK